MAIHINDMIETIMIPNGTLFIKWNIKKDDNQESWLIEAQSLLDWSKHALRIGSLVRNNVVVTRSVNLVKTEITKNYLTLTMPIYSIDTKRIITALIRKENNRIATLNIKQKMWKLVQTYSTQWILQSFSVNPSYSIF